MVEIMAVSVISLIIIGASFSLFLNANRTLQTGERAIGIQQELNRALIMITEDLKQSSAMNTFIRGPHTIVFSYPVGRPVGGRTVWSAPVTYGWAPAGGQLNRTEETAVFTVASLSNVIFSATPNPRVISVHLDSSSGAMSDTVTFNVTLRN